MVSDIYSLSYHVFVFLFKVFVVKHLKSAVGYKYLRYADSLRCLVILHDRGDDTRQGKGRAVQRMAQLYLLVVGMAIAAMQPVGLVAFEVGYRRYLEPSALCSTPCLEIITDRRGEAHVASAQAKNMVGEFQLDQQVLYMV